MTKRNNELVPENVIEELDKALKELGGESGGESGGNNIVVIAREPGETDEEFTRRVEEIAAAAGVEKPKIAQVGALSLRSQKGKDVEEERDTS